MFDIAIRGVNSVSMDINDYTDAVCELINLVERVNKTHYFNSPAVKNIRVRIFDENGRWD